MKHSDLEETGKWLREIFRHCSVDKKYMHTDITVKQAAEIVSGLRDKTGCTSPDLRSQPKQSCSRQTISKMVV